MDLSLVMQMCKPSNGRTRLFKQQGVVILHHFIRQGPESSRSERHLISKEGDVTSQKNRSTLRRRATAPILKVIYEILHEAVGAFHYAVMVPCS